MITLYAIISECQDFFAIISEGGRIMDLRDKIKKLCKEKQISMNTLETTLGFGKGYISKLGKSTPNASKIQQIADYFGVTIDYLMSGESKTDCQEIRSCFKRLGKFSRRSHVFR